MKPLKTSDISNAVGIHPNTVRLYEEWGLLPPIPRTPSGYRLFTQEHLEQVKLIRLALKCTVFGRDIKRIAYDIMKQAASSCFAQALAQAEELKERLHNECRQAEEAERYLEQWAMKKGHESSDPEALQEYSETVPIHTAAEILHVTIDMLRDWERNHLIHIPRHPISGYRMYGPDELNKLRVIRVLRRSQYSNMAILRAIQKLQEGSTEGLREALDSPELDEDRGYLCFTDYLLTALYTANEAADEIILMLVKRQGT